MKLSRVAQLIGVALLVMAANILCTVLYMVVYGHLINPGHENQFYQDHVQIAAPYCSVIAGIPLMFLAGWWVAGWKAGSPVVRSALVVWAAYAIIDFTILLATGAIGKLAAIFVVSFLTKLAAVYFGAVTRSRTGTPHRAPA